MSPRLRAALATAAYGLLHSALASRAAKEGAARLFGERFRNGWYRPLFILQALLTFLLLVGYLARLPSRVLYQVRGPWAIAMNAARLAALLYGAWAAWSIGLARLFGLAGLRAWVRREAHVPPAAEAQGPAFAAEEGMRVRGPFRFSRHPLNLIPIPLFALSPKMTERSLVFTAVSAAYFWLGSWHEEYRLEKAYGGAYRRYRDSGVPFYFGWATLAGWAAKLRARGVSRRRAGMEEPRSEYLMGSDRGGAWTAGVGGHARKQGSSSRSS